jgi:hypothetical protein
VVFDELADARRAIDMRNNLEEKIRRRKRSSDLCQVGFTVLVSHRTGRDANRPIIQRSDQRVDLG